MQYDLPKAIAEEARRTTEAATAAALEGALDTVRACSCVAREFLGVDAELIFDREYWEATIVLVKVLLEDAAVTAAEEGLGKVGPVIENGVKEILTGRNHPIDPRKMGKVVIWPARVVLLGKDAAETKQCVDDRVFGR